MQIEQVLHHIGVVIALHQDKSIKIVQIKLMLLKIDQEALPGQMLEQLLQQVAQIWSLVIQVPVIWMSFIPNYSNNNKLLINIWIKKEGTLKKLSSLKTKIKN